MAAIDTSEFQPRTLDKVERLLDLLDEMQRHPDLKGKLAMHGGTAINLFMLDIPRLSVDIDISYVGALAREEMLRERPFIERAHQLADDDVARALTLSPVEHEGVRQPLLAEADEFVVRPDEIAPADKPVVVAVGLDASQNRVGPIEWHDVENRILLPQ